MESETGPERASGGAVVDQFGITGSVLEGKYRVDSVVAEGGFGIVYRGSHLTLDKPLAIKLLKTPPEFNDRARAAFIEKFSLEARTIARISHPSIVQVMDFGVARTPSGIDAPFMVLEWLHGATLEQTLEARRGRGGRSPAETLALLRPVLDALAYAHEEGIAHRDVKPANMMVVEGRRGATLRLMDFGIAKLMEPGEHAGGGATATRNSMNAFSPQYAAPEQIAGTRTGPWTDVHALALIATEVLTDRPPYEAADLASLFGEVLGPKRPSPAAKGRDVGSWEPVLARALAIRPDARHQSAAEFLAALDSALPASVAPGTPSTQAATPGVVAPSTLTSGGVVSDVARAAPKPATVRTALVVGGAVVLTVLGFGVFLASRGEHARPTPPPVVATNRGAERAPTPLVALAPTVAPPAPTIVPPVPAVPEAPRAGLDAGGVRARVPRPNVAAPGGYHRRHGPIE